MKEFNFTEKTASFIKEALSSKLLQRAGVAAESRIFAIKEDA